MVVEFPTFCFGISLKRGTALIGFLQSVLSFIFMILCSSYADHPHELIDMSDASIVPNVNTLKILLIITAVASAIQCVLSILIIFGAETNRPLLLAPWLIFNPITLFVYLIGTLIVIFKHAGIDNTAFIFGHIIFATAVSCIGAYNITTVYRLYKHLRSLNF